MTLQDAAGGAVEPAVGAYSFDSGDPMRVTAVPDGDHTFDYWDAAMDERVQRIVAGYMTLGDYENIRLIEHLVRVTFGVELTEDAYDRAQQRWLKAGEDADNDGLTNLEEWRTASPDGDLANLPAFADAALDGHKPGVTGTSSAFAAEAMSILNLGADPCDCDNHACIPKFDVSVRAFPDASAVPGSNNQATAVPDGQGILAGTMINLAAEPDMGNEFGFNGWFAPGTLASGSREKDESFTLTGSTGMFAFFGREELEIPHDGGGLTIEVVSGSERDDAEGRRKVYGPPHGTVTLKATCDAQHKVVGWTQCTGVGHLNPTFTNENPATLHITGYASPRFVSANYETPPLTSVTFCAGSEGGMVFGCESHQWWPVFAKTVSLPDTSPFMCAAALTYPGFEFDRWDTPGLESAGPYAWDLRASAFSTVKALFKSANEYALTATTELEKGGDGTCAGNLTADPAQKYYQSGNKVRLTPHPNPGYVFASWKGDGVATDGLPVDKHPMMSDFFHSEEGFLEVSMDKDRTVTAVFDKMKALVIEGGGTWFSTSANDALQSMKFDVKKLTCPDRETALRYIRDPACVVFAFNGHGNASTITINHSSDPNIFLSSGPSIPPFVGADHPGYKLVYLASCSGMESEGAAWFYLFRAQCVVGWTGLAPDTLGGDVFDAEFWLNIQKGKYAMDAVALALRKLYLLLPSDSFLQCLGNVNLASEMCYEYIEEENGW